MWARGERLGTRLESTECTGCTECSCSLPKDLEDSYIRVARLIHNIRPPVPKHEVLSKAKWNSLFSILQKETCLHCPPNKADLGGWVDWIASHPPLWGRLSLKLYKGTKLHWGDFVSDCSDIVISGQHPSSLKNPGSTTASLPKPKPRLH